MIEPGLILAFAGGTATGIVGVVLYLVMDHMGRRPRQGYQPKRDIDWIGLSPMTARRYRDGYQPSSSASKEPPNQGSAGKPPPSRDD